MRFVTCRTAEGPRWGVVAGETARLAPRTSEWPHALQGVVELGLDAALALGERLQSDGEARTLADLELMAPLPSPRRNVICLGLNYAAHARESYRAQGRETKLPSDPVVFTKANTSVTGPFDNVVLDRRTTEQADWEVELGVIMGRRAHHVDDAGAAGAIFGYTVINDISARDLQFRHKQFFLGKSPEGFCPMGPCIVTPDELGDPQSVALSTRVNGVLKQSGHTSDQIFGVSDTISRISRAIALLPGDVLATGTPDGVGFARTPPEYLQPGDEVTCEIDGIGMIRNRMIEQAA